PTPPPTPPPPAPPPPLPPPPPPSPRRNPVEIPARPRQRPINRHWHRHLLCRGQRVITLLFQLLLHQVWQQRFGLHHLWKRPHTKQQYVRQPFLRPNPDRVQSHPGLFVQLHQQRQFAVCSGLV